MLNILVIIVLLLVCYGLVIFAYKTLTKEDKMEGGSVDRSYDILCEIKSNNTYPPMLDVFTSLSKNLAECKMELHADLRGYLDYEKAK